MPAVLVPVHVHQYAAGQRYTRTITVHTQLHLLKRSTPEMLGYRVFHLFRAEANADGI